MLQDRALGLADFGSLNPIHAATKFTVRCCAFLW